MKVINKLQKPILEELLKEYCKSKGCHVYLGSNNYPDNSTKFFINDTFYYVDWRECDNVYDVFMKIVKDLDNSKRTPEFYLTMPRNNGKTFYANQVWEYLRNDVESAHALARSRVRNIKDVIFNPPATIILWNDGTKTVVKAQDGEPYDPEKGFAMAVTKKHFGNEGNYFTEVRKWIDIYEEKLKKQQREKDEAEGILCKITLPDVTTAIESMKNLTKALKGYTAENNDTINKIENVLNSFLVCRELQGCGKCPYVNTCGTGVTCSRAREDDIIEILTTYKNILNKNKDIGSLTNVTPKTNPDEIRAKLSDLNEIIEYVRCCEIDGSCDECPYTDYDACGTSGASGRKYEYLKEYRDLLEKELGE